MKYLSDYMNDKQSALFEETKAFFAFSNRQLEEGLKKFDISKDEDGKPDIYSMGGGMYVKKENAKKLIEGLDKIWNEAVAQDIADHGLERIILRELSNHEAYYTGDIESTWDAVQHYPGIKIEYVQKLFRNRNYKIPSND